MHLGPKVFMSEKRRAREEARLKAENDEKEAERLAQEQAQVMGHRACLMPRPLIDVGHGVACDVGHRVAGEGGAEED